MRTGIIQFFIDSKGYGYVRDASTREEFHVHKRHLRTPVAKGDRVRFRVAEGKQGQYAVEVEKVY